MIEFRTPKQIERARQDRMIAEMFLRYRKQTEGKVSDTRIMEVMSKQPDCPLNSMFGIRASLLRTNTYQAR